MENIRIFTIEFSMSNKDNPHPWIISKLRAARLGFEPRYSDSESEVLPLDDLAIARHRSVVLLRRYVIQQLYSIRHVDITVSIA